MTSITNLEISSTDESIPINNANNIHNSTGPTATTPKRTSPKRYQRTQSYDESYYIRSLKNPQLKHQSNQANKHTPYHSYGTIQPGAYLGPSPYGTLHNFDPYRSYYTALFSQPNLSYKPSPAEFTADPPPYHQYGTKNGNDQRMFQLDTMYRSTPLLNYGANSYLGWHQHAPPATINRYESGATINQSASNSTQANPTGLLDSSIYTTNSCLGPTGAIHHQHTSLAPYFTDQMNSNRTGTILFEKETVGPFFKDGRNGHGRRRTRCSPAGSFCARSFGSTSIYSGSLGRNRLKLCIIMSILVIIVAVLVAMGIAVYSQVKTQNSVVKLVRQYPASFVVTGGRQLDYDADLLNPHSQSFKTKTKLFEQKIDSIFRESGLSSIYDGSQVTGFRFVQEPAGMEVQFLLKTKVNVQLQISDLIAMFDDAIRQNPNGIFQDTIIDPKSLIIENQRNSSQHSPSPGTTSGKQ